MAANDGFTVATDAVNSGILFAVIAALSVLTLLTLFILLTTGFADLRDRVLEAGFFGGVAGRFGRGYRIRRVKELVPVLDSIGLDTASRRAIQQALDRARSKAGTGSRPDRAFIDGAPNWIRDLAETNDNYRGNRYYLDLMGAVDGQASNGTEVARIFQDWVDKLELHSGVLRPDILLAPKDGNVLLCRQLADRLGLPLVLCKGDKDKSRIRLSNGKVHETDFEGLRAFCDREMAQTPGSDTRTYQVLVVDDSCKNGGQLASAAERFNKLLADERHGLSLQFAPIRTSVVLFRVRAEGVSDVKLNSAQLTVHSLVALGDDELSRLKVSKRAPSRADNADFKSDSTCEQSIRVFEGDSGGGLSRTVESPVGGERQAEGEDGRAEGGVAHETKALLVSQPTTTGSTRSEEGELASGADAGEAPTLSGP